MTGLPCINLMPQFVRAARVRARARRFWIGANVAVLTGVAVVYAGAEVASSPSQVVVDQQLTEMESRLTELRAQTAQLRDEIASLELADAASRALSGDPDFGVVVQLLGRLTNQNVAFTSVRISPVAVETAPTRRRARNDRDEGPPPGRLVTEERFTIEIAGVAGDNLSVSQFVLRLVDAGVFTDVRLESSKREPAGTGGSMYRFLIRADLGVGADTPVSGGG